MSPFPVKDSRISLVCSYGEDRFILPYVTEEDYSSFCPKKACSQQILLLTEAHLPYTEQWLYLKVEAHI